MDCDLGFRIRIYVVDISGRAEDVPGSSIGPTWTPKAGITLNPEQ